MMRSGAVRGFDTKKINMETEIKEIQLSPLVRITLDDNKKTISIKMDDKGVTMLYSELIKALINSLPKPA